MADVTRRDESPIDLEYPLAFQRIGRRPSSPWSPLIPISSPYVIIGMPGMVKSKSVCAELISVDVT
jgi:hypothetical protein